MSQRGESATGCTRLPKPRCKWPDSCTFERLSNTICAYHKVSCIFKCSSCHNYHTCDGGDECIVINTGENLVCMLTGSCIFNEIHDFKNIIVKTHKVLDKKPDECTLHGVLQSIKSDLVSFFCNANNNLDEVRAIILDDSQLKPNIEKLINITFVEAQQLFYTCEYGYDIICSMYIQIIISIYSTKTVYDNLLFKCMRNKKYDAVLKKMRELWMCTLLTGDSVPTSATC
ncbi:hypothetical protein KM481_gp25 [Harp seal herpesvirus]|uniref:Protein UL92 n=1 Tax=phocid gammaherpesvirus 3 TaxID=2560643 RepID=A0A0R5ZE30_9GAMA|nr:hypothetical protein KM481_gp25 [Harp seal herpesvirus]AJG42955.1 hypothetical protein [Harp seal herpesvirus]